jgi:hypothetical protein
MTTKQAIDRSGISPKLVRAVLRQLGGGKEAKETLADVARGGADAGFSGFTYYTDTVPFFKRNRAEIVALVESMAEQLGDEPLAMVKGFRCLDADSASIARCLYGGRLTDDDTYTENALTWFALEEVARAFEQD